MSENTPSEHPVDENSALLIAEAKRWMVDPRDTHHGYRLVGNLIIALAKSERELADARVGLAAPDLQCIQTDAEQRTAEAVYRAIGETVPDVTDALAARIAYEVAARLSCLAVPTDTEAGQ